MLIRTGVGLVGRRDRRIHRNGPIGSLAGMVVCGLLRPWIWSLLALDRAPASCIFPDPNERILAAAAPATVQRIGFAVGAAATGSPRTCPVRRMAFSVEAARRRDFGFSAGFIPAVVVGPWSLAVHDDRGEHALSS